MHMSVSVYLGLKVYSVRLTSMSAPVDPVLTVVYVTIRSMAISADVHRVSDKKLYTGLFVFKWAIIWRICLGSVLLLSGHRLLV